MTENREVKFSDKIEGKNHKDEILFNNDAWNKRLEKQESIRSLLKQFLINNQELTIVNEEIRDLSSKNFELRCNTSREEIYYYDCEAAQRQYKDEYQEIKSLIEKYTQDIEEINNNLKDSKESINDLWMLPTESNDLNNSSKMSKTDEECINRALNTSINLYKKLEIKKQKKENELQNLNQKLRDLSQELRVLNRKLNFNRNLIPISEESEYAKNLENLANTNKRRQILRAIMIDNHNKLEYLLPARGFKRSAQDEIFRTYSSNLQTFLDLEDRIYRRDTKIMKLEHEGSVFDWLTMWSIRQEISQLEKQKKEIVSQLTSDPFALARVIAKEDEKRIKEALELVNRNIPKDGRSSSSSRGLDKQREILVQRQNDVKNIINTLEQWKKVYGSIDHQDR